MASRMRAPQWPRSLPEADLAPPILVVEQDDAPARRLEPSFLASIVLLLFILAGLISSVAFAIWAHDVSHAWRDAQILQWMRANRTPDRVAFMRAVSTLGDWQAMAVEMPLLVALLLLLRRIPQAITLLLSVGGGIAIATSFKPLVARLGPSGAPIPADLLGFNQYAFPSGHAVYFLTCLVPLIWFIVEARPRGTVAWRSLINIWRALLYLALVGLIVLGGLSQVYLGYHWASDVAGGYAIAGFWTALVLLVYMRFRRERASVEQGIE